jgi:hypothetical protein
VKVHNPTVKEPISKQFPTELSRRKQIDNEDRIHIDDCAMTYLYSTSHAGTHVIAKMIGGDAAI